MEDTGILQRRTAPGDEDVCPGLVRAAADNSPAALPVSALCVQSSALSTSHREGKDTLPAPEELAVKLEDKTRPWGNKQRAKAQEQLPVTVKQRAWEKTGRLTRSRTSLETQEGPEHRGGARGEPTEPPRAAQGTARHSATGRAGRPLTTGHLRVSRRDKPPICLLAPPFPGEATE